MKTTRTRSYGLAPDPLELAPPLSKLPQGSWSQCMLKKGRRLSMNPPIFRVFRVFRGDSFVPIRLPQLLVRCWLPAWKGLDVGCSMFAFCSGSRSQCVPKKGRLLPMNLPHVALTLGFAFLLIVGCKPAEKAADVPEAKINGDTVAMPKDSPQIAALTVEPVPPAKPS